MSEISPKTKVVVPLAVAAALILSAIAMTWKASMWAADIMHRLDQVPTKAELANMETRVATAVRAKMTQVVVKCPRLPPQEMAFVICDVIWVSKGADVTE